LIIKYFLIIVRFYKTWRKSKHFSYIFKITTKKAIQAGKDAAGAITLSDEDIANMSQEYIQWMDTHNKVASPDSMAFFVSIFILPIFICACKVKVPASNNTHMNSFLIVVMNFNV